MPAHALFFPAAATYAAASLPLSVAAMLGAGPAIPGLAFPAGHAHELLFGFALAAVAGNQLGPTLRPVLALLLASWLAARVAFLAAPLHPAGALLDGLFAASLAWQIAPRALGRAKKLRNRSLPIAVVALCIMAAVTDASLHAGRAPLQQAALVIAILLLALLMLFMGGRIIAP
ncbi:MAG TPA: NnrS family protein, partial [Usitatibacter sp.]|nr:NnrS family protein [Usitatibacter sp.]